MPRWSDETKEVIDERRERARKFALKWKPWVLAAQSGKSGRPRKAPRPDEQVTYRALADAVSRFCQSDEAEA